jgi:hypothetical protein
MTAPDLSHAVWRKSKRSEVSNACVEVARTADGIALRDSKNSDDATLLLNTPDWRALIATVKRVQIARP